MHLADLKFGYRDYDAEQAAYSKAMLQWYADGKSGPPPEDWRKKLRPSDPYALIPIYQDPVHRWRHWDKYDLQEYLLSVPRVIRRVHACVEEDCSQGSMRQLQGEVINFFRQEYRERWYATEGERPFQPFACDEDNPPLPADKRWQRAVHFWEMAADLVSRMLIVHYEVFPLEWAPLVAKYADVSARWKDYLDRVNALNNPAPIQRIKKQRVQVVNGVTTVPVAQVSTGKLRAKPVHIKDLSS